MNKQRDRDLGMGRPITRRDFLDGAARTVQALAAGSVLGGGLRPSRAATQERPAETAGYPPGRTGERGHHAGSWEIMHAVRDGTFWDRIGTVAQTGERYDLVVVGAGISGLAAAFLYRQQAGPSARILVLENHDDVGGHAKRNEFTASNGKTLIGYGGSQSLQTPSYFSPAVQQLLKDINIDLERFHTDYDQGWAETRGLGDAVFFDHETFGVDRLVKKQGNAAEWVPRTPLSATAQRDLIELLDGARDYLPGLTREQKLDQLAKTTYADFLTGIVQADPQLVTYFQRSTPAYFGVGIDAVNCLDARGNGNPGFDGMDLGAAVAPAMSPSGRLALSDPDPYIYHFPDGNAGITRSFVRALQRSASGRA
jgi:spermidine dehydrogenase